MIRYKAVKITPGVPLTRATVLYRSTSVSWEAVVAMTEPSNSEKMEVTWDNYNVGPGYIPSGNQKFGIVREECDPGLPEWGEYGI